MKQTSSQTGVNIFGHIDGGFGLAKVPKYFMHAFEKCRLPFCVRTVETSNSLKESHSFNNSHQLDHPFNLYFVNPDSIKGMKRKLSPADYLKKYEIAIWYWELEKFPDFFYSAFSAVNEIWVNTNFVRQSLAAVSPVPVMTIPLPYSPPVWKKTQPPFKKEHFTFLYIFDYNSDFERKNPLGAVRAFKKAFPNNFDVRLILKSSNSHSFPECKKILENETSGDPRIFLMDRPLPRSELYDLIHACDAFVSLHRSEGFALNVLDAISLGKPAITTGYGGNMDYMDRDYPFLVSYKKIKVKAHLEFYQIDCEWADPDLADAAHKMKFIYEHYEQAKIASQLARDKILLNFNPDKTARAVRNRLNEIQTLGLFKRAITIKKPFEDEFFRLRHLIKETKGLCILLFYTVRKERLLKILHCIKETDSSIQVHIFGREDTGLAKAADDYYIYKDKGFYEAGKVDKKWFKNKKYDFCLIPFYNYRGSTYQNVFEILQDLKVKNIIGLGIEGDIFRVS
ncbi:MAG: glycosyltransferase family 4 protein [Candidatus Aureabacteria bacterium]|nr:glycosyltransferase family 4 protein [Candidatus Auribacterota bacterium]